MKRDLLTVAWIYLQAAAIFLAVYFFAAIVVSSLLKAVHIEADLLALLITLGCPFLAAGTFLWRQVSGRYTGKTASAIFLTFILCTPVSLLVGILGGELAGGYAGFGGVALEMALVVTCIPLVPAVVILAINAKR